MKYLILSFILFQPFFADAMCRFYDVKFQGYVVVKKKESLDCKCENEKGKNVVSVGATNSCKIEIEPAEGFSFENNKTKAVVSNYEEICSLPIGQTVNIKFKFICHDTGNRWESFPNCNSRFPNVCSIDRNWGASVEAVPFDESDWRKVLEYRGGLSEDCEAKKGSNVELQTQFNNDWISDFVRFEVNHRSSKFRLAAYVSGFRKPFVLMELDDLSGKGYRARSLWEDACIYPVENKVYSADHYPHFQDNVVVEFSKYQKVRFRWDQRKNDFYNYQTSWNGRLPDHRFNVQRFKNNRRQLGY